MTSTSVSQPKQARSVATRARVVAAANDLFDERGWDGVTIRAIAHRAGVSRGAIYKRFASSKAIREVVRAAFISEVGAAELRAFTPQDSAAASDDLETTVRFAIDALRDVVLRYSRKLGFRDGDGAGDGPSTGILFDRFARALAPVTPQIACADPDRAIAFVFRVAFETLAFAADGDETIPTAIRLDPTERADALTRMVVLYLSTPEASTEEKSVHS